MTKELSVHFVISSYFLLETISRSEILCKSIWRVGRIRGRSSTRLTRRLAILFQSLFAKLQVILLISDSSPACPCFYRLQTTVVLLAMFPHGCFFNRLDFTSFNIDLLRRCFFLFVHWFHNVNQEQVHLQECDFFTL